MRKNWTLVVGILAAILYIVFLFVGAVAEEMECVKLGHEVVGGHTEVVCLKYRETK